MDNNELNNNINTNLGDQIMMGDVPETQANQQPINNDQGINTILQNNIEQNQTINAQPVSEPQPQTIDTIFPNVEPTIAEPVIPIAPDAVSEPAPIQPIVQPEVHEPTQETTIPTEPIATDKKKKTPIIVVILLILVVLGLGGYIAYDKFIAKEEPKKQAVTPSKPKEKKVLLKDSNLEIVYSDIDEMHDGKVKKVPYINIDSKYAEEVNEEIKSMVNKGLEGQVANTPYGIDYQYYVNDDILSVKFTWEIENGMTVSKIYNIDQYSGKKVTNSEILKQLNIDETTINDKLVESYKAARPIETLGEDAIQKECYQKDIDAFTKGAAKGMYINNGELYVLFDMSYPAGAGIGEAILNASTNKLILNPFTLE